MYEGRSIGNVHIDIDIGFLCVFFSSFIYVCPSNRQLKQV